jgi:hypothetical protein
VTLYNRLTEAYPDEDFDGRIGVIAPYRQQIMKLRQKYVKTFAPSFKSMVESQSSVPTASSRPNASRSRVFAPSLKSWRQISFFESSNPWRSPAGR